LLALPALVLLLLAAEGLLRGLGFGHSTRFWLEYGDARTRLANPRFLWRDLPPRVAPEPAREFVRMPKPPEEFRIVVAGDMVTHGWPHPGTAWPRLLEALLQPHATARTVRVVNAAVPFCDAATAAGILAESLDLAPDALLFAPGPQELVGLHAPGNPFDSGLRAPEAIQARRARAHWRLAQWLGGDPFDPARVRELTDFPAFLAQPLPVASDPAVRAAPRARAADALRGIAAQADRAGVPLVVVIPAVNVADFPPFLSASAEGTPLAERADLLSVLAGVRVHYAEGRWDEGLAALAPILTAHPGLAEAHFLSGRLHLGARRVNEARAAFLAAWAQDQLPLRGDPDWLEALRTAAGALPTSARAVDLFTDFGEDSPAGHRLPGGKLFHDHAHLSFTGAHRAARAVAEALLPLLAEPSATPRRRLALAGRDEIARAVGYTEVAQFVELQDAHVYWTSPLFRGLSDAAERIPQREFELEQARKAATHDPNPQAAVGVARAALALHPRDPWRLKNLVEHLFVDSRLAEIEPLLSELQLRQPGDPRVLDRLRILYTNTHRPDLTFAACRQLLARQPDLLSANIHYGVALRAVTPEVAEVLRFHEDLVARFPRSFAVRRNLATARAVAGDSAGAEALYAELLRERPDDEVTLLSQVEMKMSQGKLSEALRQVLDAAERLPPHAQFHFLAGVIYSRADRILPAITEMQKALALNSAHEEARKAMEQLRALQDQRARQAYEQAQKLRAERRFAEAMPLYLQALELFPEGMTLLETVAYLYATCEDPAVRDGAKAVQYADRLLALPLAPRFDNYATAAAAYAAKGDYRRAVELADRALTLANAMPQKPDLGKLRRALAAYQARQPFLESGATP
jgi:tetratricopeptide (TPR) repeat protein